MKVLFNVFFLFFSLSFFSQNDTLAIIRHTDSSMVVKKDSKVVYRAIPNKLSIDVPNCKSFTVQAEGLKKISKNLYHLNVGAGTELTITIDIVLKNNKKITEKHLFEIKNVSHFITTINGKGGLVRMQKNHFKGALINARLIDENLHFKNSVTAFNLKIPGQPVLEVIGDRIDERTFKYILKNASLGDQIVISDIKLKTEMRAGCILLPPLVVEIY